jgi:hypothetical protein
MPACPGRTCGPGSLILTLNAATAPVAYRRVDLRESGSSWEGRSVPQGFDVQF